MSEAPERIWTDARRAAHVAILVEALEDIAEGMGEPELVEIGRYAPHVARAALAKYEAAK